MSKKNMEKLKALVYLPLKPEKAKQLNLPIKLPVRVEDITLIVEKDHIPLEVILRGLETQIKVGKDADYYKSYLVYFLYEKVKSLMKEQKYKEAVEYIEKAGKYEKDYRYHFYKGLVYKKLGNDSLAEVELKIASGLLENFSLSYFELGKLYLENKEYEDAENMFKRAIASNPEFSLPYIKLGDLYIETSRFEEAIQMYKKALEIDKGLPDVYNRLGVVMNILQRFNEAEKYFKKAIEIFPKYRDALLNLSYTLTRMGKLYEAFKILKDLEKNFPDDPVILNELGILMRELGLFEESIEKLSKALEINKDDQNVKLNLARSLMFVDRKRAIQLLKDITGEHENYAASLIEYMERRTLLDYLKDDIKELVYNIKNKEDFLELLEEYEGEIPKEILNRVKKLQEGIVPAYDTSIDTITFLDLLSLYVLAAEDYVEMEKRVVLFCSSIYGSSKMLSAAKVILRSIQDAMERERTKENFDPESFLDIVIPEIQEIDWHFALDLSKTLEKPPIYNPKTATELAQALVNPPRYEEASENLRFFLDIVGHQ
ncbi:MAG: tetratricopeptide repeat protein [Thermotogaceae bacterium]|nr:tetratricopeptide repeat protein [Thermotogaceae bacterium]